MAFRIGHNRIALGHHLDDLVETLLMNMFHHGNISTMAPRVEFFDGQLAVVRPLATILEDEAREYAASQQFIDPACRCPGKMAFVRRDTKAFIREIEALVPDVKRNLYRVLSR